MATRNLEIRVENLEHTVGALRELPHQVADLSAQFVQLRHDVRADISAIRGEVGELRGEVGELRGEVGELRSTVTALDSKLETLGQTLREEMVLMHRELAGAILATGTQMRVLHEEVLERIAVLADTRQPRHEGPSAGPPGT